MKLLLLFSPNFSVMSYTLRYFLKMAILKVKSAFGTILLLMQLSWSRFGYWLTSKQTLPLRQVPTIKQCITLVFIWELVHLLPIFI